jgi:hypothetical protein
MPADISSFPPVYLLEVLAAPGGDTEHCDNFAKLELAVEACISALAEKKLATSAEASFDPDDQQLEGIAFFNEEEIPVAFITVYHLGRDIAEASNEQLRTACRGAHGTLQETLNRILGTV